MTEDTEDEARNNTRPRRRQASNAPGQFLGFSLQATRALEHLIESPPGSAVSLEFLGDTAVEHPDGTVLVEESKSRISVDNPLRDRSLDLWRTIRNWVEDATAGRVEVARTDFRLYVSRPFPGLLADQMHAAATADEALRVLAASRAALWREPWNLPADLYEHLAVVFGADPELVAQILLKLRIEAGSGNSLDDILETLSVAWVPPEIRLDVLRLVTGWVKYKIDGAIEQRRPAVIEVDDFRRFAIATVRQLDRRDFLASVATEPDAKSREHHLLFRTYVRQLSLIEADDDDKMHAITDFIQAEADRVAWAAQGRVVESSFNSFELELLSAWKNYKRTCDITHRQFTDAERGRLLYGDCFSHSSKLEGTDVPEQFCRGSFHKLSDDALIGWHPQYRSLLGAINQSED